jgi:hypothetical protein
MTPRGDCRAASATLGLLTGRWPLPVLHEVTFDARRHHEGAQAGSGHIAVVAGSKPGRTGRDDITVCCSVGLAGTEVVLPASLFS